MKTSVDLSRLRHPRERPIWIAAVLLNGLICVLAIWIAVRGPTALFEVAPFLSNYASRIRALVIAVALTPPALVIARNSRLARVRGGSVKVTRSQHPLMAARLRRQCAALGVDEPPTLFVSDEVIDAHAHAYSAWHREFVVLGTDYLEGNLEPLQDVWSFLLGRELARLALGHVSGGQELLVAYVERLPWVRRPLRHVRAYSLDRIAAFLEPEGIRGLIIQASGRRTLPSTDIPEQIRDALSVTGFWARFTNLVEEQPHIAVRIQKLYRDGFFDLHRDLERFGDDPVTETRSPPRERRPRQEA